MMKIAMGNDHAAVQFKDEILSHLRGRSDIEITDLGSNSKDGLEYPDYALRVSTEIAAGAYDMGILLCGTGAGMSIAANKVRGIRAVVCSDPYTARLSREHNNAQVLCLGARVVGVELAKTIVDAFLDANFQGERHQLRVDKIMAIEQKS